MSVAKTHMLNVIFLISLNVFEKPGRAASKLFG